MALFEAVKSLFGRSASAADGYSLEVRGRGDLIVLHKGQRDLTIDSEVLLGDARLILYAGSIDSWNDGAQIAQPERDMIIAAVREILKEKWGDIEVDETPYDEPRLEALRWARDHDKDAQ